VALQAEGSRPAPATAPPWTARFRLGSESGQGLVEYALILIVVSVVAIFLIVSMGSQLNSMFSNVVKGLNT
jgi:pilus assembly protein Flp/PilA